MNKHILFVLIISFFVSQPAKAITVAVFCSGDDKAPAQFKRVAFELGSQLAGHQLGLVTGGSKTGLMNEVINGYCSTANNTDSLYGVIPQVFFGHNVHHPSIPQENVRWVDTLHIRLGLFHELCDCIVILPGGFGTLHELMDFLVHNQLFASKKRIIILNVDHFWDPLLQQFKLMHHHSLLTDKHLAIIEVVATSDDCIKTILSDVKHHNQAVETHFWEEKS